MGKLTSNDAVKRIQAAAAAVEEVCRVNEQLLEEHRAKEREIDDAIGGLAPTDEIIANLHALVDRYAAVWVEDHRHSLLVAGSGGFEQERNGSLRRTPPDLYQPFKELRLIDLCGLAPDLVKVRLTAIVRMAPVDSPGPMAHRPALVERHQAEQRQIEASQDALADAAAAMKPPLVLPLTPVVQDRRRVAAREADIEREARTAATMGTQRTYPVHL